MGISRSASVVIAYAMKAFNLTLGEASQLVKRKRSCIKPNNAFSLQLKTYQVNVFVVFTIYVVSVLFKLSNFVHYYSYHY